MKRDWIGRYEGNGSAFSVSAELPLLLVSEFTARQRGQLQRSMLRQLRLRVPVAGRRAMVHDNGDPSWPRGWIARDRGSPTTAPSPSRPARVATGHANIDSVKRSGDRQSGSSALPAAADMAVMLRCSAVVADHLPARALRGWSRNDLNRLIRGPCRSPAGELRRTTRFRESC